MGHPARVLHLRRRRRVCRIPENRNPSDTRHRFPEQIETLSGDLRRDIREPGHVAPGRARLVTRPVPTGSPATANTIGMVLTVRRAESLGDMFAMSA